MVFSIGKIEWARRADRLHRSRLPFWKAATLTLCLRLFRELVRGGMKLRSSEEEGQAHTLEERAAVTVFESRLSSDATRPCARLVKAGGTRSLKVIYYLLLMTLASKSKFLTLIPGRSEVKDADASRDDLLGSQQ